MTGCWLYSVEISGGYFTGCWQNIATGFAGYSVNTVSQKKRPPFYFSNNYQKLTDFNALQCVKS